MDSQHLRDYSTDERRCAAAVTATTAQHAGPVLATTQRPLCVLVVVHDLGIGGSQINAIELASSLADRGHTIEIAGPPGELEWKIRKSGLRFHPLPVSGRWPTVRNTLAITRIARQIGVDLVHTYEWGPAVDACFGPCTLLGIPLVSTVLSMDVPTLVPRLASLIVGTQALAIEQAAVRQRVHLLEPPIDTVQNALLAVPRSAARRALNLDEDAFVMAIVGRLDPQYGKLEATLQALESVDEVATRSNARLIIAGGGPGLGIVAERAEVINLRHGRTVVSALGSLDDPRPAYAAADLVLGMGSSALKALAFSKPLIVQGPNGFARLFEQSSCDYFLTEGFWGVDGPPAALTRLIEWVRTHPEAAARTGEFGRTLVLARFTLDVAAGKLEQIYLESAQRSALASRVIDAQRTMRESVKLHAAHWLGRFRRPDAPSDS